MDLSALLLIVVLIVVVQGLISARMITAREAQELGLPVSVGMPSEVLKLMTLYPQPVQMASNVEYLPVREARELLGERSQIATGARR